MGDNGRFYKWEEKRIEEKNKENNWFFCFFLFFSFSLSWNCLFVWFSSKPTPKEKSVKSIFSFITINCTIYNFEIFFKSDCKKESNDSKQFWEKKGSINYLFCTIREKRVRSPLHNLMFFFSFKGCYSQLIIILKVIYYPKGIKSNQLIIWVFRLIKSTTSKQSVNLLKLFFSFLYYTWKQFGYIKQSTEKFEKKKKFHTYLTILYPTISISIKIKSKIR